MKLIIDPKSSYQFKTENAESLLNSIHKEAYLNAGKRISEIIDNSSPHLKDEGKNFENTFPDNNYNNVISFMGDRGAGKSTAALSLAQAIINKKLNFLPDAYSNNISSNKIVKIDVVDPSLFQDNDRLIEIIISKMFDQFMKKIKSNSNEIDNNKKRELVTRFQEVFQNLKTIHSSKSEVFKKESIEVLKDLANGGNLKTNFFLLVQEYLKFVGDNANYLLIIIDDFDLNIRGAYEMVEDIRQFLHQYNVIIFVACKIEQLYDAVEQNIRETTATMLKFKGDNTNNTPEEMTSKYLLKLFPLNSRCYIKPLNFDTSSFTLELQGKAISSGQIENDILQKIYLSTGVLFLRKENKKHLLIPRNLREFIQFYNFVNDLKENESNQLSNLESFKNYFRNYWVNVNLTKEHSHIIHNLFYKDLQSKNKYIINELFDQSGTSRGEISQAEIKKIINAKNNEANISIGDVLSVIRFLENEFSSNEKELFLFAVKSFYSIQLTELFKSDELAKLKILISNNIYSKADRGLISRQEDNDFWSFEYRHLKDVSTQSEFNVKQILASFVSSLKKSAEREEMVTIYKIGESSSTRPDTDISFSMLSFLNNLWTWENHFSKFKELSELGEYVVRLRNEQLIPCFSVDLIDQIIYDLQSEEIKASYKESYVEIIDYILRRIRSVLKSVDENYRELSLVDKFDTSSFMGLYNESKSDLSKKFQEIKVHKTENINTNLNLSEIDPQILRRIKTRAQANLNYYSGRYFINPNNASSQGAKQAMNNLIKDFIPFPSIYAKLQGLRSLMDGDYIQGLNEIHNLLQAIVNYQ